MSDQRKFEQLRSEKIRPVWYSERVDQINDVEINVRYVNRTARPLLVSRRDGLRLVVNPRNVAQPSDEFSIYVTLKGPLSVIKNTLSRLNDDSNPSGLERVRWVKRLDHAIDRAESDATVVEATVEYMLSEDTLNRKGGRVYMTDQDIVVEWHDPHTRPINHPFCQIEQDAKSMEAIFTGCGKTSLVMLFRAVDNSGRREYSDRYVNIGGRVYKIPVERDDSLHTGIHITTRRSVAEGQDECPIDLTTEWMSFESADKRFHLHTTVENAHNGGPITEVLKDHLNAHAASQKLEEAKLRRELLQLEDDLQRMRYERDMQKTDRDDKLGTQKIVLEWIKTVAALVTAGLSLYAAFRKVIPVKVAG